MSDTALAITAIKAGAYDFIRKPVDTAELDTALQIQAVKCPVLFVHSTTDEVTSCEGGRELFDRAPQPKARAISL